MHAIPTSYGGVNFRSRLEARWAAFFDLLGWPWEYEPIDLAGYIPDFILDGRVLVEVKPLLWTSSNEERLSCANMARRLDRALWKRPAVLLGARLMPENELGRSRRPGATSEYGWPGKASISHKYHLEFEGGDVESTVTHWDNGTIDANVIFSWHEAGNLVQWKPRA